MVLFLYKILIYLFSPLILIYLGIRYLKKKEDHERFAERFGKAKRTRPVGRLIWMHGASVGECLSMMPLIKKILREDATAHVMVTSGTVTSAKLMVERLPDRAFHQYIPVDFPFAADWFVRHWKPDAVLWFESDFWPNVLNRIHCAGVPLVLLNGRISDRSFARWQKALWFIRPIQKLFTLSFGQTAEDARRLKLLGAPEVVSVGNLKFAATVPPFDRNVLADLLNQIGNRPRFCAGSTHSPEEISIADIHLAMKKNYADFLTVLSPRHPVRADEIEKMLKGRGLTVARRSRNEEITPKTDVYLADTIGEMGLIYQLADFVFVGGSLTPFGGQNMLEPMRLRRTVFIGPYAFNFKEIVARAKQENALIEVQSAAELIGNLMQLLKMPEEANIIAQNAEQMALSEMSVLDRVYDTLTQKGVLK